MHTLPRVTLLLASSLVLLLAACSAPLQPPSGWRSVPAKQAAQPLRATPSMTPSPSKMLSAIAAPTASPAGAPPSPTLSATPTATATLLHPSATPRPPSPTATPQPPSPTATPLSRLVVPPEIARGNTAKRQVALTFDAGASAEPLPPILAALQQADVRSTFFLTGDWAVKNPAGVRTIVAGGHEIANHSNTHPDFTAISDADITAELEATEQIILQLTGQSSKPYFRPPYGARDRRVLAAAWSAGYRVVYWTVDSGDWRDGATANGVVNRILNNAENGAIFIQHVGSTQTATGLPRIIAGLRAQGYEIVPLSVVVQ